MASGEFLWNCGYFVASINTFLQTMQQDAPEMYQNYEQLGGVSETSSDEYTEAYLALRDDAIDYA